MAALRRPLLVPLLASLALLALAAPAFANEAEDAQQAELERLRREVAGEVQLAAYNLLDELVYGWTQAAPFGQATPVFLAEMSVPVGLGTGLEALLENHLAALLVANPTTKVTLSHCPACTAVMVHSGPSGTIVSRGLDNPEALAKVGAGGARHGLYVDFTAEGAWLVLRARIVKLTPDLPIVWSQTLSGAVGTPSLLRSQTRLTSAAEARREYLAALNDQGPYRVPIRATLRSYETGAQTGVAPPPILWLQSGVEIALSHTESWTASILVGYAWLPDAYDGVMIQSRLSRLISGRARSLTQPNLYLFFGGALMTLDGPTIGPFVVRDGQQLVREAEGSIDTRASFGAFHLGLDLRLGNRVGISAFVENMPAYNDSDTIGTFLPNGLIDLHSFGTEVSFWF